MNIKPGHLKMKLLTCSLAVATLFFPPARAFCRPVFPLSSDPGANTYFRNVLQKVRTENKVPALGGVLVIDGHILVAGATGVRKEGSAIAVTNADKFPIGSITKTFTGFVAARLVQSNGPGRPLLSWGTKIKDVFPDLANVEGIQQTYLEKTLAQLTTHQADLPRGGDETTTCDKSDFNDYMICGRNDFVNKNLKLAPMPATTYSNIGPVIVANMCQQKTGKTWEDLLRDNLYTPLNLSAALISTAHYDTIAEPQFHVEDGLVNKHVPYSQGDKYNIAAPAGHVMISPASMGKYMIELMPGATSRKGLLQATTLDQYLEQLNDNRRVTRGGWIIEANTGEKTDNWAPGQKILWHNGSHGKNYALAKLLPDARVAFCAMANSSGPTNPRGVKAVDTLNEHFKVMWYNRNVLPFFDNNSSYSATSSRTAAGPENEIGHLKDEDMLTTWKTDGPGASFQISIPSVLTKVKALILVYPRGKHNIEGLKIFAPGTPEILVHHATTIGKDNSIFEFEPAVQTNKLRVEFENKPGKATQIAEALLIYDDPIGNLQDKLKGIKAIDKTVIQLPPVLRNRMNTPRGTKAQP